MTSAITVLLSVSVFAATNAMAIQAAAVHPDNQPSSGDISKQFVKGYNDAFTHGPC